MLFVKVREKLMKSLRVLNEIDTGVAITSPNNFKPVENAGCKKARFLRATQDDAK